MSNSALPCRSPAAQYPSKLRESGPAQTRRCFQINTFNSKNPTFPFLNPGLPDVLRCTLQSCECSAGNESWLLKFSHP